MANQNLVITITQQGAVTVQRQIGGIGTAALRASSGVQQLEQTLRRVGGVLLIRQLFKMADAFTNIQNRLRIVTEGTQELTAVTEQLLAISQKTRTSFEANAELYQRFFTATERLGISQAELLRIVESINKAVTISGVTSIEAANALRQLSQGLGSSQLRGQELRSVLEQLPGVADIIAKRFGVTRGELLKLGQEGKIGPVEVLEAFQQARKELDEKFLKTVPTVGQAFTVLGNSITVFLGKLGQSTGILSATSKAIIFLANNIDGLGRAFIATGTIILSFFVGRVIPATISALRSLTVAVASTGIGALAVLLGTAIGVLVAFGDQIKLTAGGFATLQDLAVVTFEALRDGIEVVATFFRENFPFIADIARQVFGDIEFSIRGLATFTAKFMDRYVGLWIGLFKAIVAVFKGLGPAIKDVTLQSLNGVIALVEAAVNKISGALSSITDFVGLGRIAEVQLGRLENQSAGAAADLGAAVREGFLEGFNGTVAQDAVDLLFDRAEARARERQAALAAQTPADLERGGSTAAAPDTTRQFAEVLADLEQQAQLLGLLNQEREVQNDLIKIENELAKQNIELSGAQKALLIDRLFHLQTLTEEARILDELRDPQEQLALRLEAVNNLLGKGKISIEEYNQKLREMQLEALATDRTLEGGLQRGLLRIQDQISDVASVAENTLVNAFNAAEDALVDFVATGEVDFHAFAESVLKDLTRLLIRQTLLNLAQGNYLQALAGAALLGGAGAAASGSFGSFGDLFRQAGGPAPKGQPLVVGERRPELFVPTESGRIVPSLPTAAPTTIQIVNVTDPNEIATALNSGQGEEAIINVIKRNRRAVRSAIQ